MIDKEEKKPKVEGKMQSLSPINSNCAGHGSRASVKFSALTSGHEDDIFTCGQTSDAANFKEMCKNSKFMVRKSIREMKEPKIDAPTDLASTASNMEVWEADYNEYSCTLTSWKDASD